jgi:hypothetical protein
MMLYATFYTDRFIGEGFAGIAKGPFIFIRPKHKGDRGLLEHEKVHVRQYWRCLWTLGFRRKTKLQREVEAYREQLKWYSDDRTMLFAQFIATRYGLNVEPEEAYLYLTGAREP